MKYQDVCKIGASDNPNARMKTLQTGNPIELELYAVIDGGYERESELHVEYADTRMKGEWFKISRSDVDRIVNPDINEEDNIPEPELPEIDTIKIRVTTVEETEVRKTTEYQCKKCGREFKEKRYLEQHKRRKTPCGNDLQCKKCFKVFPNTHKLKRHMDRKTPCAPEEIPVIPEDNPDNRCQFCNRTYSTKSNLKRHLKTCTKDKNMQIMLKLILKEAREMKEQNKHLVQKVDNISKQMVTLN